MTVSPLKPPKAKIVRTAKESERFSASAAGFGEGKAPNARKHNIEAHNPSRNMMRYVSKPGPLISATINLDTAVMQPHSAESAKAMGLRSFVGFIRKVTASILKAWYPVTSQFPIVALPRKAESPIAAKNGSPPERKLAYNPGAKGLRLFIKVVLPKRNEKIILGIIFAVICSFFVYPSPKARDCGMAVFKACTPYP